MILFVSGYPKHGTIQRKQSCVLENVEHAAELNLNQKQHLQSFVVKNAYQKTEGIAELMTSQSNVNAEMSISFPSIQEQTIVKIVQHEQSEQEVYDLTIEDCHEYFANGILVHNCLDAAEYIIYYLKRNGII